MNAGHLFACALVLTCCAARHTAGPAAATAPAAEAEPGERATAKPDERDEPIQGDALGGLNGQAQAKEIIAKLVADGGLELSNKATSAAERFHMLARVSADEGRGEGRRNFTLTAVRDGDRVATVLRPGLDEKAPPLMYATDGLVVVVDRARPGGLLLMNPEWGPKCLLTADRVGVRFEYGAVPMETPDRFLLNAEPILRGALRGITGAKLDQRNGDVMLRTKNGAFGVAFPQEGKPRGPLPLRILAYGGGQPRRGRFFRVEMIVAATERPATDYFQVTREAVEGLGLPLRAHDEAVDGDLLAHTRLVFPPEGFVDEDHRTLEAARKLGSLFRPFKRDADKKSEFSL